MLSNCSSHGVTPSGLGATIACETPRLSNSEMTLAFALLSPVNLTRLSPPRRHILASWPTYPRRHRSADRLTLRIGRDLPKLRDQHLEGIHWKYIRMPCVTFVSCPSHRSHARPSDPDLELVRAGPGVEDRPVECLRQLLAIEFRLSSPETPQQPDRFVDPLRPGCESPSLPKANSLSFQPAPMASRTLPLLNEWIEASCLATTTGLHMAIMRAEIPSLTFFV